MQLLQKSTKKFLMEFVHRLFDHINIKDIKSSIERDLIDNLKANQVDWRGIEKFQCPGCLAGKARKHRHIVGPMEGYQSNSASSSLFTLISLVLYMALRLLSPSITSVLLMNLLDFAGYIRFLQKMRKILLKFLNFSLIILIHDSTPK